MALRQTPPRLMLRPVVALLGTLACASAASAQDPARPGAPPRSSIPDSRPATTTTAGDTGLWFVPSGEVLPGKAWSFSLQRLNVDYEQGFTDVTNFPVTFGIGLADRVELFRAWSVIRQIDRDVRPLFFPTFGSIEAGGVVNEYPFVSRGWSGNQLGDLWLGAKVNLASQQRHQGAAVALRGTVKIPTADADEGAGTGRADFAMDAIVSSEIRRRVEIAAFGGMIVRGDPDSFDVLNGIRWGIGVSTPSRGSVRLTAELHGEAYRGDTVRVRAPTLLPAGSTQESPVNAAAGVSWQGRNGMFLGGALNWSAGVDGRSTFGPFEDRPGDSLGFQIRLGYHPGVRVAGAPPRATPAAGENRPPTVHARCDPCKVGAGNTATVFADAADPDGDRLTYRWSAAGGTLGSPTDRQTVWTAPAQDGPVPVTVTVTDGKGGSATDAVTFYVVPKSTSFLLPAFSFLLHP